MVAMSPQTLLSLPAELQSNIGGLLVKPPDLKALCLACKQLYDIATPLLYRAPVFDMSSNKKNSFLTARRSSHAHVRYPTFVAKTGQKGELNKFMRLVLFVRPRDILKGIYTPDNLNLKIDESTVAAIFTQQTVLQNLQIAPSQAGVFPLPIESKLMLHNVRILRTTNVRDGDDLDLFRFLLARTHRNIEKLVLGTDQSGPWNGTAVLHASPTAKLFGHGLQLTRYLPALKDLTLIDTDFRQASQLWANIIPFETLLHLRLQNCHGLAQLFLIITEKFRKHGAQLKLLKVMNSLRVVPEMELARLLRSFSGLEWLEVTDQITGVSVDSGSLMTHMATLKHFHMSTCDGNLDLGDQRSVIPRGLMKTLAKQSSEIRQLALAFPDCSTKDNRATVAAVFDKMLNSVARFTKLEVLNIVTWPKASSHGDGRGKIPTPTEYEQDLGAFANYIVAQIKKSRSNGVQPIRLLIFGDYAGKNSVPTDKTRRIEMTERVFFMNKQVKNSGSSLRRVMTRVAKSELKYLMPDFDGVGSISGVDTGLSQSGYHVV